ncbi:hypothetical protein NHX12_024888 [Muraenolepis orangiensis]|uniref:Uncharacterized protein n=1 Tax=Muraenolepis orangiensis TaxID=630683 RepID=A0A9Q0EH73_9TELE|nr:hypothetical protein NHX12_024888 [Muraenolepis orangiensis]
MMDLRDHSSLVSYQHIPGVHKAAINRVLFEPEAELIITSSESDDTSVVIMHASLKRDPYIWKIDKGVRCFDYSRALRPVATGGFDPSGPAVERGGARPSRGHLPAPGTGGQLLQGYRAEDMGYLLPPLPENRPPAVPLPQAGPLSGAVPAGAATTSRPGPAPFAGGLQRLPGSAAIGRGERSGRRPMRRAHLCGPVQPRAGPGGDQAR